MKNDVNDNNLRFGLMLTHYGKHIQRFCALHGNNTGEIRMLISAVCDAIWRSIDKLRSKIPSPQATVWLYLVMRHAVYDYYHQRRVSTISRDEADTYAAPDDEEREMILDIAQYLSESDQFFVMRYLEGYTLDEIADLLGISYDACCQRKSRIAQRMRRIQSKYYE